MFYWELDDRKKVEKMAFEKNGKEGLENINLMYQTMEDLPDEVGFQPIALQIEPTNACNLRCIMCFRQHMKREIRNLTLEELKKIVEQFPFLLRVHLQGSGEPLLNRELFDMISYLKSKKVNVSFTTNTNLITDAAVEKIANSGVDSIDISMDGATKETYEKIRKYGNFERFKDGLKKLISLRKKGVRITTNTVILKENLEELPKIVEIVHELGDVDEMTFIDYLDNYYIDTPNYKDTFLVKESEKRKEVIEDTKKLAKKYNIFAEFLKKENSKVRISCLWPWLSCYINSDGSMVPCCSILDYSFGNILKEKFLDIWNSEKYKEFRKRLNSKNLFPRCIGCDIL